MLDKKICPPSPDDLVERIHQGTEPWQIAITEYDRKIAAGENLLQSGTSLEEFIRAKLPEMYL